jgi:hypothetical protein
MLYCLDDFVSIVKLAKYNYHYYNCFATHFRINVTITIHVNHNIATCDDSSATNFF